MTTDVKGVETRDPSQVEPQSPQNAETAGKVYAAPMVFGLGSTVGLLQGKLINASKRDATCQWYYEGQPGC